MTRRVVIHVDDVGMCHGANVAFVELSTKGAVTSGSVMVPCPGDSSRLVGAQVSPPPGRGATRTCGVAGLQRRDARRWCGASSRRPRRGRSG